MKTAASSRIPERLAFVDVETTGLDPDTDRILEIGIVTLGEEGEHRWGRLLNPGVRAARMVRSLPGVDPEEIRAAPAFAEVAQEVMARLEGRRFVAHNARFDQAFVRRELERAGFTWEARPICSLMLARRLLPALAAHNLDALAGHFDLACEARHRALHDAQLLRGVWQSLSESVAPDAFEHALAVLEREPLLPAHLDLGMIDRAPEAPGVYVLRDDEGEVLHVGAAASLRRDIKAYFRLDRYCAKAMRISRRVRGLEWHVSEGPLGARLRKAMLSAGLRSAGAGPWSLRLDPASAPGVVDVVETTEASGDLYGVFETERKARNALVTLARDHRLGSGLVGLPEPGGVLRSEEPIERMRQLTRLVQALAPLKLKCWPYEGPVAVRERRDLHVFDRWRYLGTARHEGELVPLVDARVRFDPKVYKLLCGLVERRPAKLKRIGLPARERR